MTIRVLVADDHPLVRSGLQAALAPLPEVEVVAEAATGSAAIREAVLHRPDVVVMDLQMPDLNGIEATRELRRAPPLGGGAGPDHVRRRRLRVLGHAGRRPRLRPQGRRATGDRPGHHRGRFRRGHLRPRRRHPGAGLLRLATPPSTPTPFPELTTREREVLDLIAAGHSNHQIAETLTLSGKTVANHISAIFAKLQVADRTQAILRARDAGLGHP